MLRGIFCKLDNVIMYLIPIIYINHSNSTCEEGGYPVIELNVIKLFAPMKFKHFYCI